ncbi:IclR family transcriptional regulator [Phytoactinopolyspora halotolerans]|uniref:IclR family transcriptional regulator n=1 Tax=Phytoactinopolyspora halotolerans TaxID=1981512 RepID=A0A6L9S890_9ACTN|nr:IclR family transcriptional regulator [Phytoactinopolyspora halotolerans]NEE01267.1 IclR family transcriptional regulator [Phytoactinopolyspora halotolerans]
MANSSSGDSVLGRALRVFDAFELDKPALTASEIARRACLPVATAYRLTCELAELGLLERAVDGRFRVGVRLWEIAARAQVARGLREAAMPVLEDLHAAVKEHVQLGVLEGREVLFIERLSARNAVINVTQIGGRLPVHASSAGLVLLAHASAELQTEVLAGPLRRYTPDTPVQPRNVRRIIAGIKQQGYVVCPGYIHADAMGIAVPVRDACGEVVAAIGAVVPVRGTQPMNVVPALLTASRGISRALGATADPQPRGAVDPQPRGRREPTAAV